MHTQLTARRALRYAAELRFPRDTSAQGAQRAGRRGHRRARAGQARPDPGRGAVRRPAQAGQRRARAADQALAAVPRRADVRAGPRARQVGDGDDGRAGARRPHRHRGHAQRRQPRPVRPAAGPGARREGGVLRAAARRPAVLRQAGLGRGVPGVRGRAGPGLGRGVHGGPRLHAQYVTTARWPRCPGVRPAADRAAAACPQPPQPALHPVPALPGRHRVRQGLPGVPGRMPRSPWR